MPWLSSVVATQEVKHMQLLLLTLVSVIYFSVARPAQAELMSALKVITDNKASEASLSRAFDEASTNLHLWSNPDWIKALLPSENPRHNRPDGKRGPGDPTHGPKPEKPPMKPFDELPPAYTPNPGGRPYTGPPKDGVPIKDIPR
jgi:hypothetical protein